MASRVQVVGADRLASTTARAADKIADQSEANTRASQLVADRARVLAPRRSGRLAASIRSAATKAAGGVSAGTVPYALVIHNGWPVHHIAANPYVTRASEQTQPQWEREYVASAERVVRTIRGM